MNAKSFPTSPSCSRNSLLLPLLCFDFLFLCGCATTYSIPEEQLEQIDRVGAVSLLGDELRVLYAGTIPVLEHESALQENKQWFIDDYAIQALSEAISQYSPFTYVPLDIDNDALFKIYDPLIQDSVRSKPYELGRIRQELRDIGDKHDLDALFIVLEADNFLRNMARGNSVNEVAGYGISRRSVIGIPFQATHAVTRIAFIDMTTLEDLGCIDMLNYEMIEKEAWNPDFDELPSSEQNKIEQAIKKQLRDNLTYAVQTLSGTEIRRSMNWNGYLAPYSCNTHAPITPKMEASNRAGAL